MTPITLPKHLEDWARAEVAAGRAASVDELVASALEDRRARLEDIKSLLDDARAQVVRGEAISLEAFRAHVDKRLARLKTQAEE